MEHDVTLCTYADLLRVPAVKGKSLFDARAEGGDVRMIYSPMDAVKMARENPERQIVFFAIGFETTTPPTAAAILAAKAEGLKNFSVVLARADARGDEPHSRHAHGAQIGRPRRPRPRLDRDRLEALRVVRGKAPRARRRGGL